MGIRPELTDIYKRGKSLIAKKTKARFLVDRICNLAILGMGAISTFGVYSASKMLTSKLSQIYYGVKNLDGFFSGIRPELFLNIPKGFFVDLGEMIAFSAVTVLAVESVIRRVAANNSLKNAIRKGPNQVEKELNRIQMRGGFYRFCNRFKIRNYQKYLNYSDALIDILKKKTLELEQADREACAPLSDYEAPVASGEIDSPAQQIVQGTGRIEAYRLAPIYRIGKRDIIQDKESEVALEEAKMTEYPFVPALNGVQVKIKTFKIARTQKNAKARIRFQAAKQKRLEHRTNPERAEILDSLLKSGMPYNRAVETVKKIERAEQQQGRQVSVPALRA